MSDVDSQLLPALALPVIEQAVEILRSRSETHGDSWVENRHDVTRSILARIKTPPSDYTHSELTAISLAVLVDIKRARIAAGGWNPDSILDGINYEAALVGIMERLDLA